MLNFSYPLFIRPLLLLLIQLVALHWGLITIRWGMWVEYSYVKESPLSPQKLSAAISSRAPFSEFAVLCRKCSSFIDCSGGSIPTLWQVSVRTLAVKSLISLWRIEGKPPVGQLIACSTVKLCPQTQ